MARAAPWTVSHPQAPCPPQRCPAPGKAMWGGHGALGWGRRPCFGQSFTPQTLFGAQSQVASALRTGLALPRACVPQANPVCSRPTWEEPSGPPDRHLPDPRMIRAHAGLPAQVSPGRSGLV